jgi:hypothetical protein
MSFRASYLLNEDIELCDSFRRRVSPVNVEWEQAVKLTGIIFTFTFEAHNNQSDRL